MNIQFDGKSYFIRIPKRVIIKYGIKKGDKMDFRKITKRGKTKRYSINYELIKRQHNETK